MNKKINSLVLVLAIIFFTQATLAHAATPPTFDSLVPKISFYSPTDLAFDSDGNGYVVDSNNNRVVKFDPEGDFSATFGWGVKDGADEYQVCYADDNRTSPCLSGGTGGGAGALSAPSSIAVDPTDHIWITEGNNHRISIFNSNLTFNKTIGWGVKTGAGEFEKCMSNCQAGSAGSGAGQFNGLTSGSITFDSLGYAYLSDSNYNRVQLFDSTGSFATMFGWGVKTGASQLEKCSTSCQSGVGSSGAGDLAGPAGIAFSPSGYIYVVERGNYRVSVFSVTSNLIHTIFGDTRNWDFAFVKAFGWGAIDGSSAFQTCTTETGCHIGSAGSGAGQFSGPSSIDFDPDGNFYISDGGSNSLQVFNPDDTFQLVAGFSVADGLDRFEVCFADCLIGTSNYLRQGEFNYPNGLAFDPDGNLYVTDENYRIQKFSTDETFGGLGGPDNWSSLTGVTHDDDGNIYVGDYDNENVSKFDNNGNFLFSFGDEDLSCPYGMAVNSDTNVIYVVDGCNQLVYLYNTDDGSPVEDSPTLGSSGIGEDTFSGPIDVALAPDGTIYVSDEGGTLIYKFDADGTFDDSFTDDSLSELEDIEVGPDGNVYASDWANDLIHVFSADGGDHTYWGESGQNEGELDEPEGLAFDTDGNLYISESSGCRVQKFTKDGTFLLSINGPGEQENCGDDPGEFGTFDEPAFIDVDTSGNLYVPDFSNYRVQKFTPTTVSLSDASIDVAEGAFTHFTAVLNQEPTDDVTITLSKTTPESGSGITLSPEELTFTPENWDEPQTVTVTGITDPGTDGDRDVTVSSEVASADDVFDGTTIPNFTVTVHDGIEISTCEQLQAINEDLTGYYVLTDDIDCSDTSNSESDLYHEGRGFVPIGNNDANDSFEYFTGALFGNDHTISDLTIARPEQSYIGLFAEADGATFQNFTIAGSVEANDTVGALVGYTQGTVVVDNVSSSVDIIAYDSDVGGLVGYSDDSTSIYDSHVTGDITVTSDDALYEIGGLISEDDGEDSVISGSTMSGDITVTSNNSSVNDVGGLISGGYVSSIISSTMSGNITVNASYHPRYIGGLVGWGDNYDAVITDSSVTGDLTINDIGDDQFTNIIGGLAGEFYGTSISDSTVSGDMTFDAGDDNPNSIGGLVGDWEPNVSLSDSSMTGNLTLTTNNSITYGSIGGLIGFDGGDGTIENSFASGDIMVHAGGDIDKGVGGLVGWIDDVVSITNSFSQGDINVTADDGHIDSVGGLLGYNNVSHGAEVSINSSYSSSNLTLNAGTSIQDVGGLIGYNDNSGGAITDSFSSGTFALTSGEDDISDTGGFIGYNNNSTLTNNFYDKTASGDYDCTGDGDVDGCTAIEDDATYFKGNNDNEPMASWDFDDVWQVVPGKYPILKNLTSPYVRVVTNEATEITRTSALLNGTLNEDLEMPNATSEGFFWGEDTDYGHSSEEINGDFDSGPFSITLDELTCGTTYHFQAFAENDIGLEYGQDQSFTTSSCSDIPFFDSFLPKVSLDGSYYIAIAPDDTVYVGDDYNNRLVIFNSDHSFREMWGWGVKTGADEFEICTVADNRTSPCQSGDNNDGAGGFSYIHNMSFDPDGNVYVVDNGNHRIQKFTSDGDFLYMIGKDVNSSDNSDFCDVAEDCQVGISGALGGEFYYPNYIASDSEGNFYVTDYVNARVQKFDSDGNFLTMWGWNVDSTTEEEGFETCSVVEDCQSGAPGDGAGQLYGDDYPAVAVGPDDTVYITDNYNYRIQKFGSDGTFIYAAGWDVDSTTEEVGFEICEVAVNCKAGVFGEGAGQFADPEGLFVDDFNDLFVSDYGNNRVNVFSIDGPFDYAFGLGVIDGTDEIQVCGEDSGCQAGLEDFYRQGEFDGAVGLAMDSSTNLYIAQDGRIQIFSSPVDFVGGLGGPDNWSSLMGIAHDTDGNIYVADDDNANVSKFDSNGNFLFAFGENENLCPGSGLAVNSSLGIIYVPDGCDDYVHMYDINDGSPAGALGINGMSESDSFAYPNDVAVDADGNIYVADEGATTIYKFSSDGTPITNFTDASLGELEDVEVGPDGKIYASDWSDSEIHVFSADGVDHTSWRHAGEDEGQLVYPEGLAFDSHGTLFITDEGCRVQAFTKEGEFLFSMNGPGWEDNCDDGAGEFDEFTEPAFIDIDESDNLYVPDYDNYRVQKFVTEMPVDTEAPVVTTGSATSINKTSATLHGTVTDLGEDDVTTHGFHYGTTTGYGHTIDTDSVLSGDVPISFNENLTGLTCHTTYHVQAFASNGSGTDTGGDVSFITDPCSRGGSSGGGGGGHPSTTPVVVSSSGPTDCLPGYHFSPSTGRPCTSFITTPPAGTPPPQGGEGNSCSLGSATLKLGSKGLEVKCLQTILHITADGSFGPKTKLAVQAWQQAHGLKADGVVGPMTKKALGL